MFPMKTEIREYEMTEGPEFTVEMPAGAVIVRAESAVKKPQVVGGIVGLDGQMAAQQPLKEYVVLFAMVDPDQPPKTYNVLAVPAGMVIDGDFVYRTSVMIRALKGVLHVFQSR